MQFSPKIILLDGTAFLFRAYFATLQQGLTNSEGFPTGAIFGVIGAIKRLQNKYRDSKIIAIFDAKGKNHRHQIYPDYKAHRKPADDDLIRQIEPLYEIVKALGLHFISITGVEADDVIATIAKQTSKMQIPTIIASSDKDLFQLVDENTHQVDMLGNRLDTKGVALKMGVQPRQIMDFLSLTGDASDNIPGVAGVGAKTAAKWLQAYDNIAGVKANASEIKGKIGEKLRVSFADIDLSHSLVELKFDVEIGCDFMADEPGIDVDKLSRLYEQYGFMAWLAQLGGAAKSQQKPIVATKDSVIVQNQEQPDFAASQTKTLDMKAFSRNLIVADADFEVLVSRLKKCANFGFSLLADDDYYMNAKLVGCAFLLDNDSFYLPLNHNYLDVVQQLNLQVVLAALKPILEDAKIGKIGHNFKYTSHILQGYDIDLTGIIDDVALKSYCLNSVATKHNLTDLAKFYLGYQNDIAEVLGVGKKRLSFKQLDVEKALSYATKEVIIIANINQILTDLIAKTPKSAELYQNLELPLIKVLMTMERNGVLLDDKALQRQQQEVIGKIKTIKSEVSNTTANEFNLDSPKQIQQVLFSVDGLGLTAHKKTPKGQPSTDEEALKMLDHPLANLILEYRTLTKLNSTYLEALPRQIDLKTKRLHSTYHQAITATGRLSSSDPNLQNIPIRTKMGARIRSAFVAGQGRVIIAADYSQIELRIMAHISQDERLLEAFNNNLDVHNATAATMFKIALDEVSHEHRRRAKAINFGLIYGMSAFGLAKQINASRTEAKQYIDSYFANYPGVAKFMENIKQTAKNQGFVETINGRRLYLPALSSKNKMLQQHALRSAINAPMQGSSADIIKQAMLDIDGWIGADNPDIKMIMQVHDELVFEVAADKSVEFSTKIQQLMSAAAALDIPLLVEVKTADNWQQAH